MQNCTPFHPALCVFPTGLAIPQAVDAMLARIAEAAAQGCNLVVFPETCLGGLDLSWRPALDRQLALELDTLELNAIRSAAKSHDIHVAFGWLEQNEMQIYDSALLIDNHGHDVLHYRRISPGWMEEPADRSVYCCGESIPVADCAFGRVVFLLCGDLFHESIAAQARNLAPDLLLYPFARAFSASLLQQAWDEQELPFYLEAWSTIADQTLAVNSISLGADDGDGYCGGAWVVKGGRVTASSPLGRNSLLTP